MTDTQTKSDRDNAGCDQWGAEGLAGCCGPAIGKTTEGCPCGSFMKGHRFAAVAVLAVMALALLISQAGGVLGIIAFFRTF